jgi:hypothetical protein
MKLLSVTWVCVFMAGLLEASFAQEPVQPPPPPRPETQGAVDVGALARKMAGRLQDLADELNANAATAPVNRQRAHEATELSQAVSDFHGTLASGADPFRLRQSFSGIDAGWHQLRGQLGSAPAAMTATIQRIEEVDGQVHEALGMNGPPLDYYGREAPPATGIAETQRLAHALVDRAEGLAVAIRADMGQTPSGRTLAADAERLAREADAFHDALKPDARPEAAAAAFGPIDELADRVERAISAAPVPASVHLAWQAFASVEVLIHRNLGLNSPQPAVPIDVNAPASGGASPLLALADQLVEQVSAFVQVFGPTAGIVPEGPYMLADAQLLQAAALNFRQDVAKGLDAGRLAFEFRDVDLIWQRLTRRVNRIARGRTGPNIQQVGRMGATCEQLHRALGLPGYPPVVLQSVPVGPPPAAGATIVSP